ncbi:MAG: phosphotransferase family protein [Tuberibacillus sp.]
MEKIGEGRVAEIYALDDARIVKVFRPDTPESIIDEELKLCARVEQLELAVPKVFGKKNIHGRPAIVYERITGVTVLAELMQHPEKAIEAGKRMAELQYAIHSKSGDGFPALNDSLVRRIHHANLLIEEEKNVILQYLEGLPGGNRLGHGDFHPENVIITSEGERIIDWATAVSGHPLADVARTAIILKYAALPDSSPEQVKRSFQSLREDLYESYLNTYINLSGRRIEQINEWDLPVMAARLIEGVPQEEKLTLLGRVKELINQCAKSDMDVL